MTVGAQSGVLHTMDGLTRWYQGVSPKACLDWLATNVKELTTEERKTATRLLRDGKTVFIRRGGTMYKTYSL